MTVFATLKITRSNDFLLIRVQLSNRITFIQFFSQHLHKILELYLHDIILRSVQVPTYFRHYLNDSHFFIQTFFLSTSLDDDGNLNIEYPFAEELRQKE